MDNSNSAINKFLINHPDLLTLNPEGMPSLGKPLSRKDFSIDLLPLKNMFDFYGDSKRFITDDLPLPPTEKIRLDRKSTR